MRRLPATALVAALSLTGAVAGCGADDEPASERAVTRAEETADPTPDPTPDGPAAEAKTVIRVDVGEWFVRPERKAAKAGGIEFEVENGGEVEHELELVKTDTAHGGLPVSGDKADVEAVGEEAGEVEEIAAGAEKELTVSLEPGSYVLICNVPRHYAAGMHASFTVE